jgi:maltooligosyltrehalose trehalohydrolase
MTDPGSDYALGATLAEGAAFFRVWAPAARSARVVFADSRDEPVALTAGANGIYVGSAKGIGPGVRYAFSLDDGEPLPDPYSRYQPAGPLGFSMLVDPATFRWHDDDWCGLDPASQVIYELHIGTFTSEGTWAAACAELEALARLGVTCLELMPVAEFPGRWGWGYDVTNLFAPYHHYGTPDDLRVFVDRAHQLGIGVILDVIYNHVSAAGQYLSAYSSDYFLKDGKGSWGPTFNYAHEPVRQFAIDNACYWVHEFHIDGLRLDAVQGIHDPDYPQLLARLAKGAREAAGARRIVLSAEDYAQRSELIRPASEGGAGLDLVWNDDFHHAARVAATGARGGYFQNYRGVAQELLSTCKHGFLFQGQHDAWFKAGRGTPARDLPASGFVVFTQNHDQVGNTLHGARLSELTSPGRERALTAALLLGPQTPLLFMGQEFRASTPFAYFADYEGKIARDLWAGRRKESAVFEQFAAYEAQEAIQDPSAQTTMLRSKLDWSERETHAGTYTLYHDLLALRRDDGTLSARGAQVRIDGAILAEHAWLLRWFDNSGEDRLLVVNLGSELSRRSWAEPLLAPPEGRAWKLRWSSDSPSYGGLGIIMPSTGEGWLISAESACLLAAIAQKMED